MPKKPTYKELGKKVKELEKKAAKFKAIDVSLDRCEEWFQALLNAAADSAFLMDTKGTILAMNKAGAKRLGKSADELIGENAYDLLPPKVARSRKTKVNKVVRSGKSARFVDERDGMVFDSSIYPVVNKRGRVVQLAIYGRDITKQKQAENRLKRRETSLKVQKQELQDVNAALKVLLKQREQDKTELEEKVLFNVKELVVPFVQKLEKTRLNEQQKAYLNVLESNLNHIISPFAYRLSSKFLGLTPKEIQIANLVKDGKTAKQIAGWFNVSVRTIEAHKRNIRAKTGIKSSKINLRSHLLTL